MGVTVSSKISHALELSCILDLVDFAPALPAFSAADSLPFGFLGEISPCTLSCFWDFSYALTDSFLLLILSPGQDPSRSSSCIEGIMRSGSALALVDVRDILLRGDSDNTKDRCDCFELALVGLAELETIESGVIWVSDPSSSPSLSTTHDSDSFGFARSRTCGVLGFGILVFQV